MGPNFSGWISVAVGINENGFGRKRDAEEGLVIIENLILSSLDASLLAETNGPKKEMAKNWEEFAKEIHCTLKKKSWRAGKKKSKLR